MTSKSCGGLLEDRDARDDDGLVNDNDDDGTDDSDDIDRNDDEGRADGVQRGLSKCVSTAAELCRTKSRHSANRYASNVFPKTMMMMMMMAIMVMMMMVMT